MKIGDIVERITYYTGIQYFIKKILGIENCGCEQRQENLNNLQINFEKRWLNKKNSTD